ncbi:MAG: hypothetical protein HYY56_05095 [Candidatus Omnitrophica bacterium]|nr:hypothetical protein [Candidatus Omnitrophota bacterium]
MIKISEQFIVDGRGHKKAVVIPYREYEELLEDLHDLAVIADRRDEEVRDWDELKKELKKDGLL